MILVRLIKKFFSAFLTYIVVNLLMFFIPRLMPGNYVDYLASSRFLPREAVEELYSKFGLNEPLYIQFLRYVSNVMFSIKPDFGYSYVFYPMKAWDVVIAYIPWTALLLTVATITTFIFGVILGFISAMRKDSPIDRIIISFSLFTLSNPYFVFALILLLIFSQYLRFFPPGGAYTSTLSPNLSLGFIADVIWHMFLPVCAITIATSGQYIIMTRAIIVNNMSEDFFRAAEAIGLGRFKLLLEYALRPSILPLITVFGIRFGTMLSGALLTEIIFTYPGLGYILYHSLLSKDFPMIQAIFYLITIMIIITSLALDMMYSVLDPRVRRRVI
ncbi:MAG: ABC transporter permease [Ignisphaera sp.]